MAVGALMLYKCRTSVRYRTSESSHVGRPSQVARPKRAATNIIRKGSVAHRTSDRVRTSEGPDVRNMSEVRHFCMPTDLSYDKTGYEMSDVRNFEMSDARKQ